MKPRLAPHLLAIGLLPGCVAAPKTDLAAADALDALTRQLLQTIDEYHVETNKTDRHRQSAATGAFLARVKTNRNDDQLLDAAATDFTAALHHIQEDQQTQSQRHAAATANLQTIEEIAAGLRRLAIQTLNADQQTQTFLQQALQRLSTAQTQPPPAPSITKSQNR